MFEHVSREDFFHLERKVDRALDLLNAINQRTKEMPTVADINTDFAAVIADVTQNNSLEQSIATLVQGFQAQVTTLQATVASLQQNNGGATATDLQNFSDQLTALKKNLDSTNAAEAVLANTGITPTVPALPAITALSPTNGAVAGGDSVSITGTGFTGATGVSFGGVSGTALVVNSDTSITVVSPPNAAGAVNVVVTTPAGASAGVAFNYA